MLKCAGDWNALHSAGWKGHLDIVKAILESTYIQEDVKRKMIAQRAHVGDTAEHAAFYKHPEIAEVTFTFSFFLLPFPFLICPLLPSFLRST